MTSLANEIYKALRRTLRANQHSITYKDLAKLVSQRHETHQRSALFHAALTEVTVACREHDLPCLPAIVWSATSHRPSEGYYKAAHPRARTDESRKAAWEREHTAVVRDAEKFPASL
jgi:hypothetical protein